MIRGLENLSYELGLFSQQKSKTERGSHQYTQIPYSCLSRGGYQTVFSGDQ